MKMEKQKLIEKNKEKKRIKEEKISKIKINYQKKLNEQKEKYEFKKLKEENKRKELEEERYYEQQNRAYQAQLKEEKIKQVLANDELNQQKKLDDYMEKQNKIAIKQNLIREQNEYEEMERLQKINKMNLKRLEIREKNQELMDKKKFETQNKIDNKSKSVERLMISKDLENQRIIKINNEKYNMVLNHIDDLKKLDRKKRDDTSKLLDEKSKKIDNIKKIEK